MMNLEQKSGVATTTHGVLTHHLNSFGVGDIVGTMADLASPACGTAGRTLRPGNL
jgi:hypothetical protein